MWKNTINFNSLLKQYLYHTDEFKKQVFRIAVKYKTTDTGTATIRPGPPTIRPGTNILAKRPPLRYVTSPKESESPPKGKAISVGTLLLLTVPITTFCLGTWQVRRRKWKLDLIAELESKINQPPIELPENLDELNELEYRKVKVKGTFDHSAELYLGPRTLIENGEFTTKSNLISAGSTKLTGGHWVVTPFTISNSGKRILINRGWVQTNKLLPAKRPEGQIEGEVEIVGVVRLNENRGTFMPANKPHLRVFHFRDLSKMSKKTDCLPYFLDATAETTVPGGPIGGQTNVTVRNEHMSYIFTWYGISAFTAILWYMKAFGKH